MTLWSDRIRFFLAGAFLVGGAWLVAHGCELAR
jgi:uncharacterized oligopeptide transporter (OPT) family protein